MTMPDLLADCAARGIRLAIDPAGGLAVDAPQDALTPDVVARLKTHKAELLAMLRPEALPEPSPPPWQEPSDRDLANARLALDAFYPPARTPAPKAPKPEMPETDCLHLPPAPTAWRCRCGCSTWKDVPIHDGQAIRRDCGRCGRFVGFTVWYGTDLTS